MLTPLTFVGLQVFNESKNLYLYISNNQGLVIETIIHRLQTFWPGFSFEPAAYVQQFVSTITTNLAAIFSSTLSTLLQIILGLFSLFFFLRDGDFFLKSLIIASPLDDQYDEKIILKLKGAINTVVRGNLFLGIVQGLIAGLGFTIFGLPNPALWGSVVALCSFVPTVGTSLVTIPAIAYLFFSGHSFNALGLLIWVILVVSLIDNLLAPFVMGRGTKIHPLFLLFAIIGGVVLFGPIGILLGPLTVSFFFALLDIYRILIAQKK
ncbi:MAG: AI-2E family transporter [Candidatus Komeilibacteria bacterium]|nr:AI-2E family transporter [Candidatus Komeilibacteria bacterium]